MEKIKVIFLDVDGVLNSDRTVRKNPRRLYVC